MATLIEIINSGGIVSRVEWTGISLEEARRRLQAAFVEHAASFRYTVVQCEDTAIATSIDPGKPFSKVFTVTDVGPEKMERTRSSHDPIWRGT